MTLKFVTALALLLVACKDPLPTGDRIDSDKAVFAALFFYGASTAHLPEVIGVHETCRLPMNWPGFQLDGACRRGLFDDGRIYLLWEPGTVWHDSSLCHELKHYLGFDHPPGGTWDQESEIGKEIWDCRGMLHQMPAIDEMKLMASSNN